jgi:aspartate aminotransferase
VLNSPSNPTGAVHTAQDWRALGDVLADYPRVMILADDIYEHIYWHDRPFATFAGACPELSDRTITVNGVSKCYAMSGWRIGYAAGPQPVIAAMTTLQSQSTTSACTVSQAATVAALTGDQSWLPGMAASFRRRHDRVLEAINAMPGFTCDATGGTFYLFPQISEAIRARDLDDDVAFCSQLLEETGVALVPGSAFGAPGHLRISFAVSDDTLHEALRRIRQFISA